MVCCVVSLDLLLELFFTYLFCFLLIGIFAFRKKKCIKNNNKNIVVTGIGSSKKCKGLVVGGRVVVISAASLQFCFLLCHFSWLLFEACLSQKKIRNNGIPVGIWGSRGTREEKNIPMIGIKDGDGEG